METTNKITDTNTNLHLSMIADQTKLVNDAEKISVDINSPIANNISDTSESHNLVINNYSNDDDSLNIPSHNNNDSHLESPKYSNIDVERFNIDPDTIPFDKLDEKAKKFKKMEKLAKLIELKNRGYNLTKNYTLDSSYEEMCFEINHWMNYQTKKDGVELGKSFLMNAVTALEFLNDRYDPFSFKLNGWSEQIKVSSDNYNDVFGELYEKYKYTGKKIEPEIKLLLMLTASAVTFHASKSITDTIPGAENILNNQNILNSINSKINSSISGNDNNDNNTYNTKQQELYETMKNQQNELLKKQQQGLQKNTESNKNMKNMLDSLKKKNDYNDNDDSSSLSISSSITLGSEKNKNSVLKINTL